MKGIFNVLGMFLDSDTTLFVSVVILSLSAFYFAGKLIRNFKWSRSPIFVLFALFNATVALSMERASGGHTNLLIISLISAAIVPEVAIVFKGQLWAYLNIYWMSSLELQCSYLFSCAIVNLKLSHYWVTGSSNHRFAIFSLTMMITTLIFVITANFRGSFLSVLSDLFHDRTRSMLLMIYMAVSTSVLAVSGHLVSKLLYEPVPLYVELSMYMDILLKNVLILLGSYLIVFFQIRQEQSTRRNTVLEKNLKTERGFRENLHRDSLFSYCANITKDCYVEGWGISIESKTGYQKSIMDFVQNSVHPDDIGAVAEMSSPNYFEKRINSEPNYAFCIRMNPKALLSLPDACLSENVRSELLEREWIWVEFHITVVRDSATNDILIYVSLNDVDEQVSERETLKHAASTDPLTGLLNRNGMEPLVEAHLASENAAGGGHAIYYRHRLFQKR